MINFEEELSKFHPSVEVEDAEDAIYNNKVTDITDIMIEMLNASKGAEEKKNIKN